MKLVDDIKDAWKWGTNQLALALVVLPPAWAMLTIQQQDAILALLPIHVNVSGYQALMALGAAIIVVRNTKLRA